MAIVRTPGSSASIGNKKVLWVVLILLPVVGLLSWLLVGPKDRRHSGEQTTPAAWFAESKLVEEQ